MEAAVLAAVDVRKRFGALTVLDGVHLALHKGEVVGIVGPNGAAGGKRRGTDAYNLCLQVLDQCALGHVANRRAEGLGLLQRKRLELARALAVEPAVLLLDEIGGGLTDAESTELVQTVAGLRDRGIAVLWIEHIVHVLLQVVNRLVCMDAGRIIAEGEPQAVVSQAAVIDAYLGGGKR
ncbi:MAG: ABC transporter ATP-binding protein [Chloroflexi bacterium]|nr:MAG: ABC transporter ATP-binding protein [Chloroflexota bacterium]